MKKKIKMLDKMIKDIPVTISLVAVFASIAGFLVTFYKVSVNNHYFIILAGAALASIIGAGLAASFSKINRFKKAVIFASYAHNEKDIALKVVNDLQNEGFQIKEPTNILSVGDSIQKVLEGAIENSNIFLFFISEQSLKSPWVKKELETAQTNGIKIFPVLIENVELPDYLKEIFYVDLRENYDTGYEVLKSSVIKAVGST